MILLILQSRNSPTHSGVHQRRGCQYQGTRGQWNFKTKPLANYLVKHLAVKAESQQLKTFNLWYINERATQPPPNFGMNENKLVSFKRSWIFIYPLVFSDLPTSPSDARALMSPLKAFRIMTQFYTLFWWMMQERVEFFFTTYILSWQIWMQNKYIGVYSDLRGLSKVFFTWKDPLDPCKPSFPETSLMARFILYS